MLKRSFQNPVHLLGVSAPDPPGEGRSKPLLTEGDPSASRPASGRPRKPQPRARRRLPVWLPRSVGESPRRRRGRRGRRARRRLRLRSERSRRRGGGSRHHGRAERRSPCRAASEGSTRYAARAIRRAGVTAPPGPLILAIGGPMRVALGIGPTSGCGGRNLHQQRADILCSFGGVQEELVMPIPFSFWASASLVRAPLASRPHPSASQASKASPASNTPKTAETAQAARTARTGDARDVQLNTPRINQHQLNHPRNFGFCGVASALMTLGEAGKMP